MTVNVLYEDPWGQVIDHPSTGILEIRWFESTSRMTGSEFNQWLKQFVTGLEDSGRKLALVDGVQFRMDPGQMDEAWREQHIIPRYNELGVKRFAFLMPPQMPLIGNPPAPEGSAAFPTGYFGTRSEAIDWLVGGP